MASVADRLYLRAPIWLQGLAVGAFGWWWFRRRYGPEFVRRCEELRTHDGWPEERMRAYQEERLQAVLEAARGSRYYGGLLRRQTTGSPGSPFEVLARLPPLEKGVLRERPLDLLTRKPPRGTMVFRSSGTTGTPTEIYFPPSFHTFHSALREVRTYGVAGVGYRSRRVMFGVRKVCAFGQRHPPFWRKSPAENLAYCSIYHLSPAHLPDYLAFLREYRPEIVMGYPSALGVLARFALESNDLPAPARAVVTTSETVTDELRQVLQGSWRCPVFDTYGAVEGCLYASQCEHGRYHVSDEAGLIEILDARGGLCPPGEIGEVVCTGLQNELQPLLRYRLGDVARWSQQQTCRCGARGPLLESIEGRLEDLCVTRDGRSVLRFDTAFKGVASIREAQVVQESLDRFVIRVVPASGFSSKDCEVLVQNMRTHVGECSVEVRLVESIERAAGGKFRAVVCRLSPEERRKAGRRESA